MDEEYVACLIECAISGSVQADGFERYKIKQIFKRKPALVWKFSQAYIEENGLSFFKVETERIRNVVLKLARGHAAF